MLNPFEVRKTCKIVTDKALKREIAEQVNAALKCIPSRSKSISEILANMRKITKQNKFVCAGPPWCQGDRHFSEDLANIEGICGKVGKGNAKLIPKSNQNRTPTMIEAWLKKLLIYKCGIQENQRIQLKRTQEM